MTTTAVVAFQFTNTITAGAVILGAIATVATLVGTLYGVRYRVAYETERAAAIALRESLADERDRNASLATIAEQVRDQLTAAQVTIAKMEQLPDFGALVKLVERHETRAQERHEATARVLEALAASITEGR